MDDILTAFTAVPDALWPALLAAGSALVAVSLTSHYARSQQRTSLAHEAAQRDREREMALRRDVFLPAADAMVNQINMLARLADLSISNEEMAIKIAESSASLGRVQIVANNDTLQAVTAFQMEFSTLYAGLGIRRGIIVGRKTELEHLDSLIQEALSEQRRWVHIMQEINLSAGKDARTMDVASRNADHSTKRVHELIEERSRVHGLQSKEQIELLEDCCRACTQLMSLLPAAVLAARKELNLAIDQDAYIRHYETAAMRSAATMDAMLKKIREQIALGPDTNGIGPHQP